ncbi:MAG TPA: phosphate ABC transporter ATP-binding protein [Acidimicrobiales bacterium]|nr:phosphate ABC transporter ATP-binding protein [Acidimicrobiales bacterium]
MTAPAPPPPAVSLEGVTVAFGDHVAVRDVTLPLAEHRVTALVGPSGCGKTTILRSINRLHDRTGGRVTGTVRLGDLDVYAPGTRAELVRARVGMVFQKPNPFPTMSIFDNVASGLRFLGIRSKSLLAEAGENALRSAALWDSVKDRLDAPAVRLSGGQQQRLCIARALAVEPDVLLMDEPCSALDPVSTAQIEELITSLSDRVTIALVTHNMFQARRASHLAAVFLPGPDGVGELAELGPTDRVFDAPASEATAAYISGQVG